MAEPQEVITPGREEFLISLGDHNMKRRKRTTGYLGHNKVISVRKAERPDTRDGGKMTIGLSFPEISGPPGTQKPTVLPICSLVLLDKNCRKSLCRVPHPGVWI